MSVVPDDLATLGGAGSGWGHGSLPGSTLNLNEYCADGCRGGLTVIIRGAEGRVTDDVHLWADLQISGRGFGDQPPLWTTPTIMLGDEPRFDGSPSSIATDAARPVELSAATPAAHLELQLTVDAGVLVAPLRYPLVGSLILSATGSGSSADLFTNMCCESLGRVTVDGQGFPLGSGGPVDMNWLRFCAPGKACTVKIEVDMAFDSLSRTARVKADTENRTLEPEPRSIALVVRAQALLEAFDGRALPDGSISLKVE